MKKKVLFIASVLALCVMFSFSCVLANTGTDAVQGIRNFVGGAENVMEDAASGIANGVTNGTRGVTNFMSGNTANDNTNNNTTHDNMDTNNQNTTAGAFLTDNNNGNSGYTATRTSTDFAEPTMAGISARTWSWIIPLIAAVGIITLIWSYANAKRRENNNNYYND